MLERTGVSHELEATISHLEARINDESLLPFEKDRLFASEVLKLLINLGEDGVGGVLALNALVPSRNLDGTRQIADRRISRKLEEVIASRCGAAEIELEGPEGVWGSIPRVVREKMHKTGNIGIALEMTNRCTVMCDFCGFADKGKITVKTSFDSVVRVIRDYYEDSEKYRTHGNPWTPSDNFYWGSDPFDARWYDEATGADLDYGDVLEKHREICGKKRMTYTSTAMPIGEELRILGVLLWFLRAKGGQKINYQSTFRFSITDVNEDRARLIQTIAESLYGKYLDKLGVEISSNRSKQPFLAGDRAINPGSSSLMDVIGVNCKDGLLLSLRGLEYLQMMGTSAEVVNGEVRHPVKSVLADGSIKYEFPNYYYKPEISTDSPGDFYPDVTMNTVTIKPDGKVCEESIVLVNDPCRKHIRLAAIACHFFARDGVIKWDSRSLTKLQKAEILGLVKGDMKVVGNHIKELGRKGQGNCLMEGTYYLLANVVGEVK